jgi:hypothetical protein
MVFKFPPHAAYRSYRTAHRRHIYSPAPGCFISKQRQLGIKIKMASMIIKAASGLALFASFGAVAVTLQETNTNMWADVVAHIDTEEQEFAVTPVGKNRILFTRRSDDDSMTIMESVRGHTGAWSVPAVAEFASPDDADPFFDPYTGMLYYMSRAAHPAKEEGADDYDVWRVSFDGSKWGDAEALGAGVNTPAHEVFPTTDKDGTLYFASNRTSGYGGNDIYVAEDNGSGFVAENAGPVINSAESDSNPLILPDGMTLVYYSKRDGGYGEADLYRAQGGPGGWKDPVNLGRYFNGAKGDFAPSILDAATFVYTKNKTLTLRPMSRVLR